MTTPLPPTISGTLSGQTTSQDSPIEPFAGVTIADPNANGLDQLTISLSGSGGYLYGNGLLYVSSTGYILEGDVSAAALTSELDSLVFVPSPAGADATATTSFTLTATSNQDPTAAVDSATTVVDAHTAQTISGTLAGQTTISEAVVHPFASVKITDNIQSAMETLTVTVGGAGGTLSGAGLNRSGNVYTLTGLASAVTAELEALAFVTAAGTPGATSTSTLSLTDSSSAHTLAAVGGATTVLDFDPFNGVPAGTTLYADVSGPHVLAKAGPVVAASGTLAFTDANLADQHTVSVSAAAFSWSGGTLTSAELNQAINASKLTFAETDSSATGTGSVAFTATMPAEPFGWLAAGQTLTTTYNITVTDQNGVAKTQAVAFSLAGDLTASVASL